MDLGTGSSVALGDYSYLVPGFKIRDLLEVGHFLFLCCSADVSSIHAYAHPCKRVCDLATNKINTRT
jgi:hypothetical protein